MMKQKMMKSLAGVFILAVLIAVSGCSKSDSTSTGGVDGGKKLSSANIGTLRFVPAGSFQRDENAKNVSTVAAFYMGENEITWEQFVKVTNLSKPAFTDAAMFAKDTSDPVTTVTWYHCIVFCNKLSMLEGLTPVYTISGSTDPAAWGAVPENVVKDWDEVREDLKANGYRLPTEMEWEWAAMGGVDSATGYQKAFAGSTKLNSIDDFAWALSNSEKVLHKVGTKKAKIGRAHV